MSRKPPQWAGQLIEEVQGLKIEVHSLGVGMEEIRDDVKLLAEGQIGMQKTLDEHSATLKEHTEMIGNLVVDMVVVKSTLKDHTEKIDNLTTDVTSIRSTLGGHTGKIDSLIVDAAMIKDKFEEKADKEELKALEIRVARMEL